MKAQEYFENRNVIKANPFLETFRIQRFLWIFLSSIMLALILVSVFIDAILDGGSHFSHNPVLIVFLYPLVLSTFTLILYTLQMRYWKRIEERRFAAVGGNRLFLAAEQPTPDTASLPLPTTITSRPGKKTFLLTVGLVLPMALLFAGWQMWLDSFPLLPHSNHLLSFFVLFSMVFVPVLVFFLVLFLTPLSHGKITVTESGLTARQGMEKTHTVMWQEARLFAMYGTYGRQKSGASITYELSSARAIARWTWVLRKTYWGGLEPTIPRDEYNRQMQALLSLVAAKTGLPLYDLREDLPKGEPKD